MIKFTTTIIAKFEIIIIVSSNTFFNIIIHFNMITRQQHAFYITTIQLLHSCLVIEMSDKQEKCKQGVKEKKNHRITYNNTLNRTYFHNSNTIMRITKSIIK